MRMDQDDFTSECLRGKVAYGAKWDATNDTVVNWSCHLSFGFIFQWIMTSRLCFNQDVVISGRKHRDLYFAIWPTYRCTLEKTNISKWIPASRACDRCLCVSSLADWDCFDGRSLSKTTTRTTKARQNKRCQSSHMPVSRRTTFPAWKVTSLSFFFFLPVSSSSNSKEVRKVTNKALQVLKIRIAMQRYARFWKLGVVLAASYIYIRKHCR